MMSLVAPHRLMGVPELHLALFAFLLNLPWEFLQVPLFAAMPTMAHWEAVQACTRATLGDVLLALAAYWSVAGWRRSRAWLRRPGVGDRLGFILVGVLLTVALEWHATMIGHRWQYAEAMPTVPWLGTGLSPLLQWLILPPLILWMARRQLLGHEAVSRRDA